MVSYLGLELGGRAQTRRDGSRGLLSRSSVLVSSAGVSTLKRVLKSREPVSGVAGTRLLHPPALPCEPSWSSAGRQQGIATRGRGLGVSVSPGARFAS